MFLLNLDERYHSYLDGKKKLRINGNEHRLRAYGYTDDGKDITGHYVITENYKLFYNRDAEFLKMEALRELSTSVA